MVGKVRHAQHAGRWAFSLSIVLLHLLFCIALASGLGRVEILVSPEENDHCTKTHIMQRSKNRFRFIMTGVTPTPPFYYELCF